MSMLGGRRGRNDDWSTPHLRARARASERLDGPIDPNEERWLDEHLSSCADCATVAADYASHRFELRALREESPVPPRDLWARTAAAIEREARHRALVPSHRSRRGLLTPYALLAGALVVAVAIGSLYSSQRPDGSAATTPASSPEVATATEDASSPRPTPIVVPQQDVAFLTPGGSGYELKNTQVKVVCPKGTEVCPTAEAGAVKRIGPLSSPATVYGSDDGSLVVVGDSSEGSRVYVVAIGSDTAAPTTSLEPTASPSERNTATPTASLDASSVPSSSASSSSSPGATVEPSSPTESASPVESPAGTIEIARDVEVVDTSAAYSPDGSAFAFTARPADGSHGPDIYVWRVGDTEAKPVTTDHRSVFGSWVGDTIVGSGAGQATGTSADPLAFALDPSSPEPVSLPQTGRAWRPAVDPKSGAWAVYWAGALEPTADGTGWTTGDGRLVLGRWDIGTDTSAGEAQPTPLGGDQAIERSETTIADGPVADWDARWDETGTRLAVWIAEPGNPSVGRLSLYVVDPFDGRIVDLENPPLRDERALAGFSIADGRLAWTAPAGNSGKAKDVQILAWTDDGFGQIETVAGDVLLVR